MARRLFIVAAIAVLALILCGETFSLEISGTVFWNEAVSDTGAADVLMCARPSGGGDTLQTTTNCCEKYFFDVGENNFPYDVWAHHIHHVVLPCPVSGPDCSEEVETPKREYITAPRDDIDFDLELDCGNDQEPCSQLSGQPTAFLIHGEEPHGQKTSSGFLPVCF